MNYGGKVGLVNKMQELKIKLSVQYAGEQKLNKNEGRLGGFIIEYNGSGATAYSPIACNLF